MNSYILLRHNKESGPFTRAQLVEMGLKSSDLLWVECQSVCWQHPGEIADLKNLLSEKSNPVSEKASPVNEKNGATLSSGDTETGSTKKSTDSTDTPEMDTLKTSEKKFVFVELPANSPSGKKETISSAVSSVPTNANEYKNYDGSVKATTEKVAEDLTTNYSRPLDEIKEMYVKKMQQDQQLSKHIPVIKFPKGFKKIAIYAGFALVGAVAMLLINKRNGKQPISNQQNILPPASQNTVVDTAAYYEPAKNTTDFAATGIQDPLLIEESPSTLTEEKKLVVPIKKTGKEDINNLEDEHTGKEIIEKNRSPADNSKEPTTVPVEILSSQVSVKANEYIVGSFGGIRNLEMTLQNESKYLLDKVTVELKYLNPEGIILKTEHLHFQSVYPGGTETIAVKKSKRGTKVAYMITKIESKQTTPGTTGL